MPSAPHRDDFPYTSYKEYVSELSATDDAYEKLRQFLISSPETSYGHSIQQVSRSGSVKIIDCIDGSLESQEFTIGVDESKNHATECATALAERPSSVQTRIILFNYHRDPFTGEYIGVNANLLDNIGARYALHPEVMMWHFGSDYGLDKRFFNYSKPPIPSALASRTFCHLHNHYSLFSCCVCSSAGGGKLDTGALYDSLSSFGHRS